MQSLTLVLGASVLVGTALALTTTLGFRMRRRRHDALVERLRRFRFHKMLAYLGVDRDTYIRTVPLEVITDQLRRCALCNNLEVCDACLNGKRVTDMHFCPNYGSIIRHSRMLRARH